MISLVRIGGWFVFFALLAHLLPIDRGTYYMIPNAKYRWMGEKICGSSAPYENIFVGSSHVWAAIDPARLPSDTHGQSLNLGLHWPGRNLQYVVARDLIERHSVKRLFIEFNSTEPVRSHRWFKFIAANRDFFDGAMLFTLLNETFKMPEILNREMEPLHAAAALLLRPLPVFLKTVHLARETPENFDRATGWRRLEARDDMIMDTAPPIPVGRYRPLRRELLIERHAPSLRAPYLERIATLARARGVELHLVFIPARFDPLPDPDYLRHLESYGTVAIPDLGVLYQPRFWSDPRHLNELGAEHFTRWLVSTGVFEADARGESGVQPAPHAR